MGKIISLSMPKSRTSLTIMNRKFKTKKLLFINDNKRLKVLKITIVYEPLQAHLINKTITKYANKMSFKYQTNNVIKFKGIFEYVF